MEREQLWAPWRLDYVTRSKEDDPKHVTNRDECFLCRLREADPADDAANHVVLRGERNIVVLNRFPYNNGHLLIAPLEHLADPTDLDDETSFEQVTLQKRLLRLLRETISPDGFNIGLNLGRVAGAGLPGHLHWHIVPRWFGDANFMPVVGNADVIPQSLDALNGILRDAIADERP